MKKFQTLSSDETKALGAELARKKLKESNSRSAKLISLEGDLGTGKTTFVQGFLREAGYKGRITSPTFIFMRRFKIKNPKYKNIFHVDAYRIRNEKDFKSLGFENELKDPENIFLVEWGGNIKSFLRGAQSVKFIHGKKETERSIKY